MPSLQKFFNPKAYFRFAWKFLKEQGCRLRPNLRGVTIVSPGHFYSPLLDIESLGPKDTNLPFDGAEWWENVNLNPAEQEAYYADLIQHFPVLPFPEHKSEGNRYYFDNAFFSLSDAFTLSGVIRKEKPRRIVEVGSGYSSAVMLDTAAATGAPLSLTFIEPFPEHGLYAALTPAQRSAATVLVKPVQEVPLSVFDALEAQDILFIDSSHVAKVGSDVAFLFLRILPRLKPGVLVHVHDIFYPYSYPEDWIRRGLAWNESLILRAFLAGNGKFQVMAFNSFAGHSFPELFARSFPAFLRSTGGSIWLRKVA